MGYDESRGYPEKANRSPRAAGVLRGGRRMRAINVALFLLLAIMIGDAVAGAVIGFRGGDLRPQCNLAFVYARAFAGHGVPGYCGEGE